MINGVILLLGMSLRALAFNSSRITLAIVLMAFSVVGSAGSMKCFLGFPMEEVAVAASVKPTDCCAPEVEAPKPEPENSKCCCIDVMEKSIVEVNKTAPVAFQIDFPIIEAELPKFEFDQATFPFEQVRWPEVHGPPGIKASPNSPRAPPAA